MGNELTDDDASSLIARLAEAGGLHDLLNDRDVRTAVIQELRDLDVPAPGLVYRLIVAAVGGCASFLGAGLASRLQAFAARTPALARVLHRIAALHHGARAKAELKTELLAALRGGTRPDPSKVEADEASSLDMVLALHGVQGFERVLDGLDEQTETLLDGFRRELKALFHDIVAPTLAWPNEAGPTTRLGAFDRLKYTAGLDPLQGREEGIDLLHRFVGDPSMTGRLFNFRWLLLTAPGGAGKTRLAYEFTRKHLDRRYWEAGKLDLRALGGLGDPAKWRPRRPTFLVVDYAQAQPETIRHLLLAFSLNAKHYDVPVRLLMLERTAEASWTERVLPNDGNRPTVLDHAFGLEGIAGRPLPPVPPDAIAEMMARRFAAAGLPAPAPEALLAAASRIDPPRPIPGTDTVDDGAHVPRPLFALAAAEEWIAETRAAGAERIADPAFDRDTVLRGIVERERQTRWQAAARNDGERRRYEMALALATYVQGFDLSALADKDARFGPAARWLPDGPPDGNEALLAAVGGATGHLPPLEPDLLGEFFLLECLTQPGFGQAVRNGVLVGGATLNPPQPMIMLLRARQDFGARLEALGLPQAIESCASPEQAYQFARFAVDYISLCARQDAGDRGMAILEAVSQRWAMFPNHPDIAVRVAQAIANGIIYAGSKQDWFLVEELFTRIDALRGAFPDHPDIALAEVQAAFNGITHAGTAQDWPRVDRLFDRIDALRDAFPDHPDIALREAQAAVNGINHAGTAQDWPRVDRLFDRIDALRGVFPNHPDIALEEAKAAFNGIYHAGTAQDWPRVDGLFDRIDALRDAFPDHPDIALIEAQAAVNGINHAGAAQDWPRVDGLFDRLDALRDAFPDHPDIAPEEAKAAANGINHAGTAQDWPRVDRLFARIDALRGAFPDHPDIAVAEARAAFNGISDAGTAQDWPRVGRLFARLDALRGAFPNHPDIALEEAKAAFNGFVAAQHGRVPELMRDILARLHALSRTWGDDFVIVRQEGQPRTLADLIGDIDAWLAENDGR